MSVFGSPAHDEKYSAVFAIKTLLDMNHETDCFSIWCCNDLFEEIMFINKPFHGGFGLMTNLGIPKPVFWALKLLADSYSQRLALPGRTDADVEYAVFRDGEKYQVFVYSQAVDYLENRSFSVKLSLDRQFSSARMVRIDDDHCNPKAIWQQLGSPMDPTPAQVETIKEGSKPIEETVAFRSENGCTHIPLMLSSNDVIVLYLE